MDTHKVWHIDLKTTRRIQVSTRNYNIIWTTLTLIRFYYITPRLKSLHESKGDFTTKSMWSVAMATFQGSPIEKLIGNLVFIQQANQLITVAKILKLPVCL